MVQSAPFGTWKSPITSKIIAAGSTDFKEVHTNASRPNPTSDTEQDEAEIFLVEGRPSENGRSTILSVSKKGEDVEILPKEYTAAGKIHEYGGGAAFVPHGGRNIIFNDPKTNLVYNLDVSSKSVTEVVTADPSGKVLKYADFHAEVGTGTLAVRETHFEDGTEVRNEIVVIETSSGGASKSTVVVTGADFYSHPRFSPDGKRVCWMQWNHPDMPWTGSELYVADWNDGNLLQGKYVAGKTREQAICQPRWAWDGSLWFVNDPKGIWNLYKWDPTTDGVEEVVLEGYQDVEVGFRELKLGNTTYIQLTHTKWVIAYCRKAVNGLIVYDTVTKDVTELHTELVYVEFHGLARVSDAEFTVIGSTAKTPPALYLIDITKPIEKQLLKSSASIPLPLDIFSPARSISFPKTHGNAGTAYAIFAPPANPDFRGIEGTRPPLIVSIHGGPTSHESPALDLQAQYFTSRGYAYVHVNHTGSTGFNRAYRQELNSNWGVKDVEDTLSCIDYLANEGLIDRTRVGIRGGSAGGYSVLQALVSHPKVFAAGCSLYGVGNLKDLGAKTHKFESHYLWDLIFPPDASDEDKERIMRERSPCFHAQRIESPLVLLQGREDRVVPMGQAVEMESVMRGLGKDVRLVVFEGEGHGWKRGENIRRSIEEEEGLWGRTLVVG
ncbi:alpha/beta-Hydrolase [Glarea lozoyensis ATCC 20868]|uniref:Alpha/beta-Hydrolase n=1 Tax=Glarea lozoyensis (strain ATCC 20868 / MF5171) TaxID=1116229 RepID=S3DXQ1_GLAL2|nr:alpha/beta-Hydrolase [Glarea lozoyensis ATCC 20868]EPE36701.1 alpha/beta-Hydrolase [Glarea lozoyensis ATCC 20868]